jgi:hypothetical protein
LEIKENLTKSCIWSVALYGSEEWTLGEMNSGSLMPSKHGAGMNVKQ